MFVCCVHILMDVLLKRGFTNLVKIDSGGQARVYKAEHVPDGKLVAIKIIHVENPNNTKLDDDLKRELQIISNVQHPNCIKVHKLLRSQGKVYIVMDYMINGTIGSRIRNDGELCEWHARLWFCPIARAIKYLHEHRIAHRDLKLDNILLDSHWNPILTDFGFSRFVNIMDDGQIQKSNTYCGTPSYNPPEVLKQIPYNPFAADIWCMGIMLFIMINKIYPFDKNDREKMYECQISRRYKLRDQIEMKSSIDVKDLIDRLLEPNPDLRPTIHDVCNHPWFPIVLRENEFIRKQRTTTATGDQQRPSSPDPQQQQQQQSIDMTKSPGIDGAVRNTSTKLIMKAFKNKQPTMAAIPPTTITRMKR